MWTVQYRTVHVRAEAYSAAASFSTDQSGALLHSVLWLRLRAVSALPLHHDATRTDSVRLPRTNIRPDLPGHLHALRSLWNPLHSSAVGYVLSSSHPSISILPMVNSLHCTDELLFIQWEHWYFSSNKVIGLIIVVGLQIDIIIFLSFFCAGAIFIVHITWATVTCPALELSYCVSVPYLTLLCFWQQQATEALCFPVVCTAGHFLTVNTYFVWCCVGLSLRSGWIPKKTWHKYLSCEWTLLKRFPRSEVKGRGHDPTGWPTMAEAYISTLWRRSSVVKWSIKLSVN